ncbi:hypothetical protein C8R48DRAFT_734827 [Suillus tomentosus]|nr:hypothetical protein C8R48DRAFT_734827 [Suillus tomentosus]
MLARIFTISVIALLLFQDYVIASVIAAVVRTSASSYSCGSGSLACCMEVRENYKRRYIPVLNGAACCYTVQGLVSVTTQLNSSVKLIL